MLNNLNGKERHTDKYKLHTQLKRELSNPSSIILYFRSFYLQNRLKIDYINFHVGHYYSSDKLKNIGEKV